MYPISVYFEMIIQLITIISYYNGFDQASGGLDEGSDVDLFFPLKASTLRRIPSFLSLHQPRTSHEYNLCILAMFTISCKDVNYVNWSNLGVFNLRVLKSETHWESAVKQRFPDDIVVKLATYLTI